MNYIIFNHDGSIKNVNFAEIIVQGNNLVDEIFVAVEGRSTDSYLATAYFELPNGESNFLTATPYSHSIDQSSYNGYKFLLTGAQTALYGRVRMSLKLEGVQGETLWTYEQVLTINKSGYNPDFTMITMSQYAALVQAMGSLQEKFVVNNARFYSSLANAQADLDNLAFNQCVIIADTSATDPIPEIYFKNAESQLELLAGIGEYTFQAGTTTTQTLSPGSDATVSVSFVASGKTITMNFTFGIPRGNTGATGNGIASIEKYSTEGQVDTYRITYTNGSHFDFDVTNGTLAGHLLSSTFEYDDERLDSLSLQLAKEIRRLVDADGSKVKSIMASKPTSDGGVQTYSIVWDYNVNIIPGALNIESGNFYFEDDGVLTSIDSNLEDYTFSIFHEVDGTSVEDFGYIEIVDTAKVGSGTLTQAELVELRKPISFIRYKTGVRSYDMLISYYSARQANNTVSKYFRGFMHKGSEDFDSAYEYNLSRSFITVTNLDSTTTGGWSYTLNVDAYVDKTPTQNSTDLITSGGVYDAVSALDAKISKNAEDIATLTEALIKKDLYETQEATFLGMTAVPAGAMVKAYLDGFKGNSAVVNQLVQNGNFESTSGWSAFDGTLSVSNNTARISFSENAPASSRLQRGGFSFVAGHTYLITATVSSSISNTAALGYFITSSVVLSDESIGTTKKTMYSLFTPSASGTGNIRLFINRGGTGTTGDYVDVENFMLIDLTAVPLTTAEMADVATAKAALKPKGMDVDSYIPFNAGTLTDSKPTKLYSRNAILASLPLKSIGAYTFTGEEYASVVNTNSSGIVTIQINVSYYYGQVAASNNNCYMPNATVKTYQSAVYSESNSFYFNGTNLLVNMGKTSLEATQAVLTKIFFELATPSSTISQAVIDGLVEHEYSITLPTLKSAGSVQDESKVGGSKIGTLNLGTPNWEKEGTSGVFAVHLTYIKQSPNYNTKGNLLCDSYVTAPPSSSEDKVIRINDVTSYSYLRIKDSTYAESTAAQFKTAKNGEMLNYEKTDYTDFSDPISYPEIVDVYAGGSIEVVGDGCDATTKVYFYVEA